MAPSRPKTQCRKITYGRTLEIWSCLPWFVLAGTMAQRDEAICPLHEQGRDQTWDFLMLSGALFVLSHISISGSFPSVKLVQADVASLWAGRAL